MLMGVALAVPCAGDHGRWHTGCRVRRRLAVQTVETGFGDANPNNGSELDAGYGVMDGGKLYLMLTGNLEANFNKLEIFIDSKAGGQSVFDSSGNDGAGTMDGLVFDAGFTADYHIIVRRGNDGGNDKFDLDFANLVAQSASGYLDVMGGPTGSGTTGTGRERVADRRRLRQQQHRRRRWRHGGGQSSGCGRSNDGLGARHRTDRPGLRRRADQHHGSARTTRTTTTGRTSSWAACRRRKAIWAATRLAVSPAKARST